MTKFVENAEDAQAWFVKEGDRLGKLAGAKGAVAGKKLDEFKMKQNVGRRLLFSFSLSFSVSLFFLLAA